MNKLEEATKKFLKVKNILLQNQENFALAKAYKKPWKWYREHTTSEAIEILRAEVNAQASMAFPGFDSPACLYRNDRKNYNIEETIM